MDYTSTLPIFSTHKQPENVKKLVIFGTRDLAELAHFYFKLDYPEISIAAHTVDEHLLEEESLSWIKTPLVPFSRLPALYDPRETALFLPIASNSLREEKYYQGKKMGFQILNYISPRAIVYPNLVGDGNFIFESNVIQPFVTIGSNNIFWSGNHIGHHSRIDNHNFITSHVVISGHVHVSHNCYLGVNSTIRDGVELAPHTTVGMGARIGKNTEENRIYSDPHTKPFIKQTLI